MNLLSFQDLGAIAAMTQTLEALNSCVSAENLLNGAWLLQYSTAREIRSLKRLPLVVGFALPTIFLLPLSLSQS